MNPLSALESRVAKDLQLIDFPAKCWVPPRHVKEQRILDVVIVGAGQCGLAAAFGLLREHVSNILLIDANPPEMEGPWSTFARMRTLRTGKHVSGPDLGIPSLTPRAWYEATYGSSAWNSIDFIAKSDWQKYLTWFGKVLKLPLVNQCRLTAIGQTDQGYLDLTLAEPDTTRHVITRKLVLASGLDGNGRWVTPPMLAGLPPDRWAHCVDAIDFSRLEGKRIAIIGGGASAFDNAATALEHRAAYVDLCIRRKNLPTVNLSDWTQFTGFLNHYADMSDEQRWDILGYIIEHSQPPTQDSYDRCRVHENFRVQTSCIWQRATATSSGVRIESNLGVLNVDFVIAATGYEVDLAQRAELSSFSGDILLWRDRYCPSREGVGEIIGSYPYLGPHFEFLEKNPGTVPVLRHIHNFTFGATASMGLTGSSVTGIKYGAQRLVRGITRQLFLEDLDHHRQSLRAYDEAELNVW